MLRRCIVLALAAIVVLVSVRTETTYAVQPINFIRGTIAGGGFVTAGPTTLTVGPDGRLYVADGSGKIQALTLDPVTKAVTSMQQITTATNLQEVYGIAFDPADSSVPPPIYVTNTVSGFGDAGQAPAGTYLGKITKISGANYATRTDIISGLPVSNSGHEANGLAFGPDGRLYIAQGSTTNGGIVNPNTGLFQRPEVPTSGAILVADIKAPGFNGNITYSPPNTYSDTVDQTGGDVSTYAAGLRNPYDIVFHSNGKFYNTDNGPNSGYGPPSTGCATQGTSDASALDELNLIVPGAYYGHPNRNRGRTDPRQCIYHPGTEASNGGYTAPMEANLPASSDGLAEYTASTFGGQMQGDLLYAAWVDSELHRVKLSPDGLSVVSDTTLATGLQNALDVAVGPDGTIYVAEYGGNKITYFKPDETPVHVVTVTGIVPAAGPIAGGQPVTITGTNFTTTAETTVNIGGQPLANVVVQNSMTITGTTPPNTVGAKDVVVANSVNTGTLAGGYTYAVGGGSVPPVANAGPDQSTPIAHENHAHVTIDGRASFDPDGFIATYLWTEGTTALTTNPVDSIQLTLGEHLITLTVTDNDGMQSSDSLRVIVTQFAENPKPYFCPDMNGDIKVNSTDQLIVAKAFNKRFGMADYTRVKDWNGDRTINSTDMLGVAKSYGIRCPLVDQQIRSATVAMEKYQNINAAIADGYAQVTPFIPGQGRHMIKGGLTGLGQDAVFDPAQPESLLYEPDSATPGGWRLGGAMYIMPINLVPLVPDGFDGNEDSWHYHTGLCIWNNGGAVAENTLQADCLTHSGNPVWIEKAGWLVHLWNFVPNRAGRFVEVSNSFFGLP